MLQQQTAGCLEQPMTGQDNDTAAEGWVPPSNTHQPSFNKCCKGKQLTAHRFKWPFHFGFHEPGSLGNGCFKMSITVWEKKDTPKAQYHLCIASLFSIYIQLRKDTELHEFLSHKLWYYCNSIIYTKFCSRDKSTLDMYTRTKKNKHVMNREQDRSVLSATGQHMTTILKRRWQFHINMADILCKRFDLSNSN